MDSLCFNSHSFLRMPCRIYHQEDCFECRCNNNRRALLHLLLSLWDRNTEGFLYRGNCCSSSVSMNLKKNVLRKKRSEASASLSCYFF